MQTHQIKGFYDFGSFRLDVANRLLWHNGEPLALTLKEFEILFVLVERAGNVVEKEVLLETVWKDVFVEEGTLARNVSRLRKKLEAVDSAGGKIIETLPKRGYRFLPPVTRVESEPQMLIIEEKTRAFARVEETLTIFEPETTVNQSVAPLDRQLKPTPKTGNAKWAWLALAACSFIAVIAAYQVYFSRTTKETVSVSRIAPFSGEIGRENTPSFSPDGKQLVYAWDGGNKDNFDIYVRLVSGGDAVRLTDSPFHEQHPTFSPDGSQIAFVRSFKDHGEVVMMPALGGSERSICRLFSGFASISFAPDGKTLAVIDTEDSTGGKQFAVYLVDLQTGSRRRLNAPGDYVGETTPRFSPDGKSLAFVRVFGDNDQDLFVTETNGAAEPRRLTSDHKIIHSLAWDGGAGNAIFFVSLRVSEQPNVWRVPLAGGGQPELILTTGKSVTNLAFSPDGEKLAFVETRENMDIWQAEKNHPESKRLAVTNFNEHSPDFSPDASKVVFISDRSGRNELWLSEANGKNQRRLTDSEMSFGSPRFSPDGSQIAFDSWTEGNINIFTVSAEGGAPPRRLTFEAANETSPIWSADGNWIYFLSNRAGRRQVCRISAKEPGEITQITSTGANQIIAARGANTIYFTREDNPAILRIDAEGEQNERVAFKPETDETIKINALNADGIYFLAKGADQNYKIRFFEYAGETIRDAGNYNFPGNLSGDLTISFDGTRILYVLQNQNSSNIMLAEIARGK